ncbi:hypothetical protein [Actinoplanes auranticolor]|uniref:Uncharacterized protein n=1 Tax=Actinoplanes auranticolor TaxID=47988 RepID=A0A919VJQ6_9ACTN|nr:hypothetical protein [Actinoplanes auranticolor]GIM65086.1 hypothetical protein Aau02nite_14610 [Actinoplanes auranticolor]
MRRSHPLLVTVVALAALSACGSSEPAADKSSEVATLTSPAAQASTAPKPERPRERLDGTPEEFEAMLGPYNKCLKEHGALPKSEWFPDGTSKKPDPEKIAALADKAEAADRICNPQYYPLPPWEKDPANPEARDFARDVVKCLKEKGVKYVGTDVNGVDIALGGEQNHMPSVRKGLDLMPECERQAAAQLKK